ncbi:MAG TPA: hypothetical protein VMU06_03470 [Stellaceae bacterium]|nr:hypothetical protein [Stellaceae bacterium]
MLSASDWIIQLALGGLLGTLGQGIRAVAGLKKLHDQVQQQGKELSDEFEPRTLLVSLLIGFIAGALADLAMIGSDTTAATTFKREALLPLVAAGYAGTDFIEAFMSRYLPNGKKRNGGAPSGAPADAGAPPAVG